MAQGSYSIKLNRDVPLGETENLLAGLEGRTLEEDSVVVLFLNQEAVSGSWQITVGSRQVLQQNAIATLQATVGVMPIIPDDVAILTTGEKGQEIIVNATNGDGAAAREMRLSLFVIPVGERRMLAFLLSEGVSLPAAQAILSA